MRYVWPAAALALAIPPAWDNPGAFAHGIQAKGGTGHARSHPKLKRRHRAMPVLQMPDGASAQCRDGTFSFSASRRGTCSHPGGVAIWL
ncbi:DUF3761 domain-containing protein [Sphingomonas kyeonggiensis]|uniref:DUF3761 domain-containing protein n=1 Tax=Sphingomonas kyeonggiensis TaxID=1268553 RepID=UPI001613B0C6